MYFHFIRYYIFFNFKFQLIILRAFSNIYTINKYLAYHIILIRYTHSASFDFPHSPRSQLVWIIDVLL